MQWLQRSRATGFFVTVITGMMWQLVLPSVFSPPNCRTGWAASCGPTTRKTSKFPSPQQPCKSNTSYKVYLTVFFISHRNHNFFIFTQKSRKSQKFAMRHVYPHADYADHADFSVFPLLFCFFRFKYPLRQSLCESAFCDFRDFCVRLNILSV